MPASAIAIWAIVIVAVVALASWLTGVSRAARKPYQEPHGDTVSPRLDPPEPEHAPPGSGGLAGPVTAPDCKSARIANAAAASSRKKVSARGGTSPGYEDCTKKQLVERAREIGIKGRSSMSKQQLIAALHNH